MIGILIGVLAGALQLFLLYRLTKAIGGGGKNGFIALFAAVQFFVPAAALLLCALLFPDKLIHCGVSLVAVLITGALTIFFISKGREKKK